MGRSLDDMWYLSTEVKNPHIHIHIHVQVTHLICMYIYIYIYRVSYQGLGVRGVRLL